MPICNRQRPRRVTVALAVVTAFAFLKKQYEDTQEALRGGDWSQAASDATGISTVVQWFVGRFENPQRVANSTESVRYVLQDAWYHLTETVYQIYWKQISDPDSPLINK